MSNRHLARSIVMQSLYQWDFKGQPSAALPAIVAQNIAEFGTGLNKENEKFIEDTVNDIVDKIPKLDEIIKKYAPHWDIAQMSIVDRNILRIGVYEMTENDSVPAKVAINEAIEVAKSYGGQSSGKFVNGILGAMYNDMTEEKQKEESKKE